MSVEATTDTNHEYMYEKTNESRDSEEEIKIKHVDRKRNYQKPEKEKPNKFRKSTVSDAVHRTGANFTIVREKQRNV